MIKAFNALVKPANDQLGRDLGTTKIEIEEYSRTYKVPVTITYYSHMGKKVIRTAGTASFYRSLGLVI